MPANRFPRSSVGLRLLLEPLQQDRLRTVILDGDGVVFLVDRDLREERHLPRALAIGGDPKIDYGKRVIDRAGTIHLFPEADVTVGHQHDALAAILARQMLREAYVVTDAVRRSDVADAR